MQTNILGVKFKKEGRIYHFDAADLILHKNDQVLVNTDNGVAMGTVVTDVRRSEASELPGSLKNIIRKVTADDLRVREELELLEEEARKYCIGKIAEKGLSMKLITVECLFDRSKMIFYFTADARVDFRELVKDLASVFKTRIELRQIGVRDESKMMGGMGICGRALCCSSFLGEFHPVSIKMAKEQGLSLNPTKISGTCGRLMCCLKYESEMYSSKRSGGVKNGENGTGAEAINPGADS